MELFGYFGVGIAVDLMTLGAEQSGILRRAALRKTETGIWLSFA